MPRELTLIFAVVLSTLPPLPQRGLVLETRSGVELQTLSGRVVTTLPGVDLAYDQTIAHKLVVRDRRGIGHWVWAVSSPTGHGILAQWSAECEVPVAYLVANGKLRKYGDETVALGWLPSGDALVHFRAGGCGGSGRAGIYAVPRNGKPRLMLGTPRFAQYAMWGG